MPSILSALWALLRALVTGRPVRVRTFTGTAWLHPRSLRVLPAMAGADPEDDDDDDDPAPPDDDDDDEDDDDEDDDPPEGFDAERAMRTIREQRKKERQARKDAKEARKRADAAEAALRERERADETDQQKVVRERDEAQAAAQRARDRADQLAVNEAIRDACAEQDVPAKKVKRVLRLIDRDGIGIDADGTVDTDAVAEALDDLLEDVPELKSAAPAPAPPGDDDEEEQPERREPPGGKPDRKRKPKELTLDQARKLARDNPAEFNRMFEAGKIPAKALGG